MESFPPNSHKAKASTQEPSSTREPIEPIVVGEVIQRKKPLGKRVAETFLGGDAKSVFGYVVFDVLVPAAKDMAADAVSQGIERMLFGEARSTSRSGRRSGSSHGHVNYTRFSSNGPKSRERDEPRTLSRRARTEHDFDEIILATRPEADLVIDRMFDLVNKYDVATVADLFDLVGVTGTYQDAKWGWSSMQGAQPVRVRNGYLLDLPRPEPVD